MKAKVTKAFRDENTWDLYEKGAEYEGDAERVAELEAKGFVKPDGGKPEKPKAKAKKD